MGASWRQTGQSAAGTREEWGRTAAQAVLGLGVPAGLLADLVYLLRQKLLGLSKP